MQQMVRSPVAGQRRAILEVSSRVKSTAAFESLNPASWRDFVFDPASGRLLVGGAKVTKALGHSGLTAYGGFDEDVVAGGRLIGRGPNGEFLTNEWSGHYGQNWNDVVRQQFSNFMSSFNFDLIHTPWA